ncbi:MAG: hypothetical protein IIX48_02720 [Lachnospiraceae bacterium]|nr:hypothetical protein [Lachnospiraceae bacterium]
MNSVQKILLFIGGMFAAVGAMVSVVFIGVSSATGESGVFVVIPLGFVFIGLGFIIGVIISIVNKKIIVKRGNKYVAKIYGYVDNTSFLENGEFTQNVKVHYFDRMHIEREAILPTSFAKGSNLYPIGMTIDIYEYHGKFGFDPKSVRGEILPGEEELMDDKPVSPDQVQLVAVTCPNCGSSFQAAAGYSSKCPYCESYLNV